MCKQIQHVSDGPEIWFIRVGNRHLTDGLAVRKLSVFKGSRLLSSSTINSTVGTNQVNFLRRNRYIFGLCVSGGTVPGKVVSPAECLDRVEGYILFLSDVRIAEILFPHLGYDVSLVLHTPLSELLCGCCPQAALGEEEAFQKNHTMKRLLEILRTASPNAAETMLALCEHLADFDAKKS